MNFRSLPLSFAQERLWFLEQLEPGTPVYNIAWAVRLSGDLKLHALKQALDSIIDRHEVLRTTYVAIDGVPQQVINPPMPLEMDVIDLRHLPAQEREATAQQYLDEEVQRPFDLASDCMLRALLIRSANDGYLLLLVMHHIASDGWSRDVIVRELSHLYRAFSRGEDPELPPLPMQYADYAIWQRERLIGEVLEQELEYWTDQLADLPPELNLPFDRLRNPRPDYRGGQVEIGVPTQITRGLARLAREEHVTLFMLLLTGFMTLLHRYTGQEDIPVGVPIAGRLRTDTESLIGFFVNTLVLRGDLSQKPTFRGLLKRVRSVCLDAYDHQEIPFEKLVAALHPERSTSQSPLFQVMFGMQIEDDEPAKLADLSMEHHPVQMHTAKFDLSVSIRKWENSYRISMIYSMQLFDEATVWRLLEQYVYLLGSICREPDAQLDVLKLAEPESVLEKMLVLNSPFDPPQPYRSIVEAFRAVAQRAPEQVALEHGTRHVTYRELDEASDELAKRLIHDGVSRGETIGVYIPAAAESILACVGILKSGASYLPLDTTIPVLRTKRLLEEARARRVLTIPQHATTLQGFPHELLFLDASGAARPDLESGDPIQMPVLQPEDSAYVNFTSGSTGQPKGVRIPHRGVLRLVVNADYVHLGDETRLMHLASPAFDASTFEIWGPLLNGGTCILPEDRLPSVSELGVLLETHRVDTLWLTSTWFNAIVDEDASVLQSVKQLLVGGEALSVSHVRKALDALPNTQVINGYGPTENTTFTCCYRIPRTLSRWTRSVPIGRPIQGTHVFVLDQGMEPVAPGVPGELFIGGQGLALEYLNDENLTEAQFVASPLSPNLGERMYRSGDRVRIGPSDQLEFLGRADRQLKIRGFRVEPAEIEAILSEHPSVLDAHIVLHSFAQDGPQQLIGYVVPMPGDALDESTLRQFASHRLPSYMVPSSFSFVSSFPRTSAGKIDEEALPEMERDVNENESFVPPRSETEAQLLKIWEQLLQTDLLSVRSDFFDLGGHSLLAVQLIARIKSVLHISLPLSVLFDSPTIEALAKRIEASRGQETRSTVVRLTPGGEVTPFFCVPPAGASVYHFSYLAQHMSPDIPLYGIQPLGLEPGEHTQSTVESMATRYVADLRLVQPEGPYMLGGRCFGAFVAFEMAQQLTSDGEEVSLLALIDPAAPPGAARNTRYYVRRAGYFRKRGQLLPAILRYLRWRTIEFRRLWIRGLLANATARRLARAQRIHQRAQNAYRVKSYPGVITFLSAEADYHPEDNRALWQHLASGGFELHLIPGDHRSMTEDPHVATLVSTLEQLIRDADRGATSRPRNGQR